MNLQREIELLNKVIKYIESCEFLIDKEYGKCRSVKELIRDNEMPNLYFEVKELKNELLQRKT